MSEFDGLVSDWLDRLRRTAQLDVESFQRYDRLGELAGRAESFALFILECLQRLREQAGLLRFGVAVNARVAVEREGGEPIIVVAHDVKAIEEGLIRKPIDIADFYARYFPFNAVMEGEFSVSRQDTLAQRYFQAVESEDIEERRAVIAIYCMRASDAFSTAELRVVPPPTSNADIPFITETAR